MPVFAAMLSVLALVSGGQTRAATAPDLVRAAAAHADALRLEEALATAAQAEQLAAATRDYAALSGVERVRAVITRAQGERYQSQAHARRAIEHGRRAADQEAVSLGFTALAAAYQEIGDWARALDYAERAFEARTAPTDDDRMRYLMQRGIVLHELRDGAAAIRCFEEALALARRRSSPRTIAFALLEIGLTRWLIEHRPADALQDFADALQWARQSGSVTLEPAIFTNWGGALRDLGRYAEAIERFRAGLAIRPGGRPNSAAATLMKNLGQTLALAGRPREAEPVLREARELADRMNSGHAVWQARMELAMLLAAKAPAEADLNFREAIERLEAQTGNAVLETFRAGIFGAWLNKYDPFDRYIDFLLNRGEPARAFDVAERARARTFLDTLSGAREQLARVVPPELAREETTLLSGISRVQGRLRAPDLTSADRAHAATELSRLEDRLSAVRLRLAAEHPGVAHARYPTLWTAAQITGSILAPDEYVVMFYVGERQTTCWILARHGTTVVRLPGRDTLSPLVTAFLDELKTPGGGAGAGDALRATLSPALAPLSQATRVVIIPHGILNYLPFEALRSTDGRFLAVRHAISYAPSASSLAFLRTQARTARTTPAGVIAIGNPPAAPREAAVSRQESIRQVAHLKPLQWAAHELRQISSIFGSTARILQGRDATERALRGAGVEHAAVLHFATHGVIDEEKPERSALALAPQLPFNDGILQVREIYRWRLRATLVTLSACETALGRDVTGEGLVGLSRAFFSAGAGAVAASLWSVDDAATAEYMQHFYRAIAEGARIDDAARSARQKMIEGGGRFSAPYYWAAFVVSGNAAARIELPPRRTVAAGAFVWLALAMGGSVIVVVSRRVL